MVILLSCICEGYKKPVQWSLAMKYLTEPGWFCHKILGAMLTTQACDMTRPLLIHTGLPHTRLIKLTPWRAEPTSEGWWGCSPVVVQQWAASWWADWARWTRKKRRKMRKKMAWCLPLEQWGHWEELADDAGSLVCWTSCSHADQLPLDWHGALYSKINQWSCVSKYNINM